MNVMSILRISDHAVQTTVYDAVAFDPGAETVKGGEVLIQ